MALNSDMRITLILLLLFLLVSACSSKKVDRKSETKVDPIAIQLSNSAMERFQDYIFGRNENIDSLKISLTELDKAIEIEPTQIDLYSNKANILLELNRDEEAIQVLKKALTVKSDFAEIMTTIGFLNEKRGETGIAQEWYQKAMYAYDKRIDEDRFVINSKVNKAFLLFFTENESSAKDAFEKLLDDYPENDEVKFSAEIFNDFDKEKFLNELSH
ncbi:MAG: tetratricopeptide repeat protein [Balneola sp.]